MSKNPSSRLNTKSSSVRELLKSSYFEIPDNQREYRWEEEHREKLWDDLIVTMTDDCLTDRREPQGHFLGAVVVIGNEQSMDASRWKVIDGQQRLTTISILADCLRPYAERLQDSKLRRNLSHVLLDCILSPGTGGDIPRVRLNRADEYYQSSLIENESFEEKREFWRQNPPGRDEVKKNLVSAFEFFKDRIDSYLESSKRDGDEDIRNLIDTLVDGFYFLIVRTEDHWMAYRLFETLNERGLDLSQADLIRNSLLESASDSGSGFVDRVNSLWRSVIDDYENQSAKKLELPQIIQFSYTFRHEIVKREKIFDKVSGDLRSGVHDALELASEFKRDSENWCAFLTGDLSNWNQNLADAHFAVLDPLWKSHCAPFILATMDRFSDQIPELERCLLLCEHYLFRQGLVCRDSVSSLQEVFGEASAQLKSGQDLDNISGYFNRKSPEDAFVQSFSIASVRNMKQGFYAMWKLEKFLFEGEEVGFRPIDQSAAQHLEHIMPRKPSADWGGIETLDGFNTHLNRLGNFLVLSADINQHIKNKSFLYKIENDSHLDYAHSALKLVAELLREKDNWCDGGEWSFLAIVNRQNYLADNYAANVWRLL